jgi:hypothetical protein
MTHLEFDIGGFMAYSSTVYSSLMDSGHGSSISFNELSHHSDLLSVSSLDLPCPPPSCTALVPYSLSSPFHDPLKTPDRFFSFFEQKVHLQQDWKPDGVGGTELGFGASVYNSSIVLALFIESMALPRTRIRTAVEVEIKIGGEVNSRVREGSLVDKLGLELGCGPGLVSIVASMAGMRGVLATDGDMSSVQLAARNIRKNCEGLCIESQQLLWFVNLFGYSHDLCLCLSLPLVGGILSIFKMAWNLWEDFLRSLRLLRQKEQNRIIFSHLMYFLSSAVSHHSSHSSGGSLSI